MLLGSLLLVLEEDGLDALDGQNDGQDHQQDAEDGLSPGAPVGTAGGDETKLSLGVDEQRGQGDEQHEEHGDPAHGVLAAHVAQPGSDGQQSQGGQQLVGGAKQSPDLAVAVHAQGDAQHDGDQSGNIGVGQDLLVTGFRLSRVRILGEATMIYMKHRFE